MAWGKNISEAFDMPPMSGEQQTLPCGNAGMIALGGIKALLDFCSKALGMSPTAGRKHAPAPSLKACFAFVLGLATCLFFLGFFFPFCFSETVSPFLAVMQLTL